MNVVIYSTTTCPYCQMVKEYLDKRNVSYKEKLVDQDDSAREEMVNLSGGFLGVPFTVVKRDGSETKIVGFDKGKLNEALGLN